MTDMRERIATVLIDTVDIGNYLVSCEVDEVRNGISTCSIVADYSLYDFINIRNGLSINVEFYYSDDTTTKYQKFNGIINNIKQQGSDVIMQGVDISWKTTGETITKVYRENDSYGGDPGNILIDMYSYVDIVADNSTIDPTSVVLPEITCDSAYVAEKTRTIVDALAWDQWYSPVDNKQHVTNPDLYTLISKDFIVGDNILDLPDYNDNIYQTVNEIELQGVYSDSAYEQKFNGDGSTTKFTLDRKPLSTYIYVTVGGVEQKGSVDGANTTYDYLINKQQGFIEFKNGSIPASGTNNIVVNYTATELTSVTVDDEDSQVDNTKRKIVISVKDAISVDDGIQRAKSLIKKSKSNYYNFDCEVINGLEYSTHNKLNYSDSVNNVFLDNAFINKITWKYPSISDTFSIANKQFNADDLFYRTEERVRRLERKRQEGQILTINKISNASLKVRVDDLVVRRASFGSTIYNENFYIDNATQIYDTDSNGSWDNLDSINGTNSSTHGQSVPGAGYATNSSGSPQKLLLYLDNSGDEYEDFNNKIVGISFDIIAKTTGTGITEIESAQLMINYFPVGEIKTSLTSFTNTDSTITLGGNSDKWNTNLNYYNFTRDGFGIILKFKNSATTINLKSVGVNLYYKDDPNSIDVVKSATKLDKTAYDNGTDNSVTEVTLTHTTDNKLEVTSTV